MPTTDNPLALASGLSRDYLLHHRVCPHRIADDGTLVVATAPDALTAEVERLIERLTTTTDRSIELARIGAAEDDLAADVRDLASQPPVVRYVNLLVRDAYDAAASDIHLEANHNGLAVRFRVDGVLVPAPEPPRQLQHAVVEVQPGQLPVDEQARVGRVADHRRFCRHLRHPIPQPRRGGIGICRS